MQIICKDGTTIQCEDFEVIGSGVLFFQERTGQRQAAEEGDEDEDSEEAIHDGRASGFIPMPEVHFVLPDEMVQQTPQPAGTAERSQTAQVPPNAQGQQSGGMSQQQQMQNHPGNSGPQGGY
ncbi:hypothetical protein [Haloarcula marina]|uniref:hypothetical protein n=1 Tax=Haloarcula marina TaxID=2961574 RepID=UPI0020B8CD29|nr:hypothetical protein [Halomicroarcula marina]